jgi:hypothetical protein
MSDAISQHKKMAMGESVPMAKGKSVIQKYARGGAVMAESKAANLPAKGAPKEPMKASGEKIATYKKGGMAAKKGVGLTIAVAIPMRKAAGRGR